jgi:uncharacterized protein (TIGR03067 family)
MIVMFVALFVGVSGSAFLMMQGTNPSRPQVGSLAKTDNSPTKDDERKVSAVESKATFDDRDSQKAKSAPDAKTETEGSIHGMPAKKNDGESKVRQVASSRLADSSGRSSSGKNRRIVKRQTTTFKLPEPLKPVDPFKSAEPADNRWDEDLDKLQGTWQIQEAEYDGGTIRGEAKQYTWDIKGDKYTIKCNGNFQELWSMKLNSSRVTKTIDGTHDITRQTLMGIYQIKGDTLKICYDLTGRGRPDNFEAGKGSRRVVYTLERH